MDADRIAVEQALEKTLASPDFAAAPKMRELLRYLVEAELRGEGALLKGYAIGVDVFERDASFDPGADSIVRVQVGRLRKLLERHYAAEGADDPVRISIPKGAYRPVLTETAPIAPPTPETPRATPPDLATRSETKPPRPAPAAKRTLRPPEAAIAALLAIIAIAGLAYFVRLAAGPDPYATGATTPPALSIAVLPMTNMSREPGDERLADALTDSLITALSKVSALSVTSRSTSFMHREPADLREVGAELGVRYILEGGLQRADGHVRLNLQLIDAETGAHVWAQVYDRAGVNDLALQDELVQQTVSEIQLRLYHAAKQRLAKLPPDEVRASDLFLLGTWVPGSEANTEAQFRERLALLEQAVEIDPTLGPTHGVLADMLANASKLMPSFDTQERRDQARAHAERAQVLAPSHAGTVFNLAAYHYHMGEIEAAMASLKRVSELNPHHPLVRLAELYLPHACAAPPEGAFRKLAALEEDLSTDNPSRWVAFYSLARLQLAAGALEDALESVRASLQIKYITKSAITFAALLERLGRSDEALKVLRQLKEDWPSVDVAHFAEVAIVQRCPDSPEKAFVASVFHGLAERWRAAAAEGAR